MLNLIEETEYAKMMDKIAELESRVSALESLLSGSNNVSEAADEYSYRGRLDDYIRSRLQSEVKDPAVLLEFDNNPDRWIMNEVISSLSEEEHTFAKSLLDYYNLSGNHDTSRSLAIICKKNKKMMRIVIERVTAKINYLNNRPASKNDNVVSIKLIDGWEDRYPKYLKKLRIVSNNLKMPHMIDEVLNEIYTDLKSIYGWVYIQSNKDFMHTYQRYP